MKKLLVILLIAFSCSEDDDYSHCAELREQAKQARLNMEDAVEPQREMFKQEYLDLTEEADRCFAK